MQFQRLPRQESNGETYFILAYKCVHCITIKRNEMKTIDIKGKPYVTVSERVKAIRNKYGFDVTIDTEIHTLSDDFVVMKAYIYLQHPNKTDQILISTGFAKEKEGDTFINKGSHLENCETSAVGRALAFAGFGIDAEIASADEIVNSDSNSAISDSQKTTIENMIHDSTLDEKTKSKIEDEMFDMTYSRANDCIEYLSQHLKEPIETLQNYDQKDINKKLDEKLNDPKS